MHLKWLVMERRMEIMKKLFIIIMIVLMVVTGCGRANINTEASNEEEQVTEEVINETESKEDRISEDADIKENNDIVQIDDTNKDNQAETEEKNSVGQRKEESNQEVVKKEVSAKEQDQKNSSQLTEKKPQEKKPTNDKAPVTQKPTTDKSTDKKSKPVKEQKDDAKQGAANEQQKNDTKQGTANEQQKKDTKQDTAKAQQKNVVKQTADPQINDVIKKFYGQDDHDKLIEKYPTIEEIETKVSEKKYYKDGYIYTEYTITKTYLDNAGKVLGTDVKVEVEKEKAMEFNPAPTLDEEYKRVVGDSNVYSNVENQILDLINQEREKEGLSPLKMDNSLVKLARIKSADMGLYKYIGHVSPNYGSPADLANKYNCNGQRLGENLMFLYKLDANFIHKNFMESPSHKANIIKAEYNEIGIGIVKIGSDYFVTQIFRTR